MSRKNASSKNNKNQSSRNNRNKTSRGVIKPPENDPPDYPWQVRFLIFLPVLLAVVVFFTYVSIQADDALAFDFLSNVLEQFSTSPIKIRGEALNIIFGLVVFLVWSGGQAFEGFFSLLDKFISWVAGTQIKGSKDARKVPVNNLHVIMAFLAYALFSILTVGVAY